MNTIIKLLPVALVLLTLVLGTGCVDGPAEDYNVISGTITITDIPTPQPDVYIFVFSYSHYWGERVKINMNNVNGSNATLSWSIPVDDDFIPNQDYGIGIQWYPIGNNEVFSKTLLNPIKIGKDKKLGNIGTISIKTITISGTINVTLNEETIPKIELIATEPYNYTMFKIVFYNPAPNTEWSVTLLAFDPPKEVSTYKIFAMDDGGKFLFEKDLSIIHYYYNVDISNIDLYFGNIEKEP